MEISLTSCISSCWILLLILLLKLSIKSLLISSLIMLMIMLALSFWLSSTLIIIDIKRRILIFFIPFSPNFFNLIPVRYRINISKMLLPLRVILPIILFILLKFLICFARHFLKFILMNNFQNFY